MRLFFALPYHVQCALWVSLSDPDGKPVLLVGVTPHHALHNQPWVTFEEEEEEEKKRGRTSGEHINRSCGSRVNVWILEFHLQHLLWDSKWQPGRDCGRSTCRIRQRRSKTLLTQSRVPWLERYADYFHGSKRRIKKKIKPTTKIQWKDFLVEHTVVMVMRGKRCCCCFYIRQQLPALSCFGERAAVGHMTHRQLKSSFLFCDSKHLCLHRFTHLKPQTASCVKSTECFVPANQAAAVRATCSAPSASKHTRLCVRAKKKPWQLFDAWRTVTTLEHSAADHSHKPTHSSVKGWIKKSVWKRKTLL